MEVALVSTGLHGQWLPPLLQLSGSAVPGVEETVVLVAPPAEQGRVGVQHLVT